MPNNITFDLGSGGPVVATDDISGIHYGITKIGLGVEDSIDAFVSATTPMPVELKVGTASIGKLAANSGVDIGDVDVTTIIPGTGATNLGKAIDTAAGSTDTGVAALVVRDDTLTTLTPVDGDFVTLRVGSTGALHVVHAGDITIADGGNSITIDWAGTAPPIGGGTEATALLVTIASDSTGLVSIDDNGGSITIDSSNLVTIAGAVSGTEMQVDVVAPLPAGTNAIGKLAANSGVDIGDVDVTSVFPGTGATNLGKAMDSAVGGTDTGVAFLAKFTEQSVHTSVADGDYLVLEASHFAALNVEPEQHHVLDSMNATTGWAATGNDTLNLATDVNHIQGTLSLTFDKVDGAANTVRAAIEKTITSTDLGGISPHDLLQVPCFVSTVTDIDYVFICLGTDASNYNEWRIPGADITGNDWVVLAFNVGDASFAGSTGNGWNPSAVTYLQVGVAFNAETDTLSGIQFDEISFHTNQHVSAELNSEVTSSTSTPNINVQKVGNKVVNTQGGNISTGTQRITIATDDANLAAMNTSLAIMDDWDETNRAAVNLISSQVGIAGGTGVDGATVVRVSLATDIALPAGTNAIGKLSANSGVDIGDVDILTQPARDRATDNQGVALQTDALMDDTTVLTPKFAIIDAASTGNNTLVAAVTAKKIRVLSLMLIAAGTVIARFESGANGTALSGQMNLVANSGFTLPFNPLGWFESGSNVLLNLELSAGVSCDGVLVYVEV